MTLIAFVLVATSVIMHSLWHFLCKSSGKPSPAFFAIFSTSLFFTMLPIGLSSGVIPHLTWDIVKFLLMGGFFGVICDIGLIWAYKYSDISLAYPLARALPVFLTMIATSIFGWGKEISFIAGTGMMIIFSGCIVMAFSNSSPDKSLRDKLLFIKKGLPGILLAAVCTTGYTISDSFGINAITRAFADENRLLVCGAYSCCRELPAATMLWLVTGFCRLTRLDCTSVRGMASQYHPYAAGVAAALAYLLILVAMGFVSNVSFLQAFRQLSLPVGAFLGYLILKEKITYVRLIGLVMIMAGLVMCVI